MAGPSRPHGQQAREDELLAVLEFLAASDALDCPVCGRSATVVPVDAAELPDRLCVDCGVALFVDPVVRATA